jgi:hypothetical protein
VEVVLPFRRDNGVSLNSVLDAIYVDQEITCGYIDDDAHAQVDAGCERIISIQRKDDSFGLSWYHPVSQ